LSYPLAREAFRAAGANVVSIGLDAQGIKVDEIEQLCRSRNVRAIFLTPQHQFPTTVTLTPERRLKLLALAERFDFTIVEDDYDHEFHFVHQPLLPLASASADGRVVYLGSMSKVLLPSLRLGYLAANKSIVDEVASEVLLIDRHGDQAIELAFATLIEEGELQRFVRKALRIYAERRETFAVLLRQHLGKSVAFDVPDGGLAFWVQFDKKVDLAAIEANAQRYGVRLQPGAAFTTTGQTQSAARLGFASFDEQELGEAVRRLARAARA
jgi:GntR family transcriptional regulator / MocR family aminotransferase